MNKDDLAKLFSGPEMVGFSQLSDERPLHKKANVHSGERSPLEVESRNVETDDPSAGGGAFDIVVRENLSQLNEKTDHRLGFGLHSAEWSSLFFRVLGCPLAEPYVVGEDIEVWTENRKTAFQRAIPEYPMLARLWNPFSNVWYGPDDIVMLKLECQRVMQRYSKTDLAFRALLKIETACDEASNEGLGLQFLGD